MLATEWFISNQHHYAGLTEGHGFFEPAGLSHQRLVFQYAAQHWQNSVMF